MKKNKMMRLASVLLIMTLLSTSVISGTFAKYVSSASGKDQARVAYWGFGLDSSIEITDLFKDTYSSDVDSKDGDDVIAPGTANFKTFKFAYTDNTNEGATAPEVSYTFTVDVSESTIADDIKSNKNIQWAVLPVSGEAALPSETSTEWSTWDNMISELKGLSGDNTDGVKEYAPNTAPAAFADNTEYIIAWQWIFETADNASTTDVNETDVQDIADTALGNKATLDTVKIVIKITAEQTNA